MDLAPVAGVVVIIGVLVGALTVARRWAAGAQHGEDPGG